MSEYRKIIDEKVEKLKKFLGIKKTYIIFSKPEPVIDEESDNNHIPSIDLAVYHRIIDDNSFHDGLVQKTILDGHKVEAVFISDFLDVSTLSTQQKLGLQIAQREVEIGSVVRVPSLPVGGDDENPLKTEAGSKPTRKVKE